MNNEQLHQLLYEALETEMGGVQVYKTAIRCAVNKDLKAEWEEYLEQTQNHEQIVRELLGKFNLDPGYGDSRTQGRAAYRGVASKGDGNGVAVWQARSRADRCRGMRG